jgi:hypothetical protein
MSDRFKQLQNLAKQSSKRKHQSDDEEDKPTLAKKNKSFLQKR